MKKYILQMLCAFIFSFTGFSQTVTITASAGFTQLEPTPFSNSYGTQTTGVPAGTTITYSWVATGGTVSFPNSSSPSVQWNNTPDNTNAKSIKVTISYPSGGSTITRTDTKTVTIKHIGTIGNISVNGTNVSAGGTFANLPCGTSSITVSSAIPATFPSTSVIYSWTLPANWTTPNLTTTTNSISVTPSLSGSGNITVSAKRNDGAVTQNATISVTRNTVASNAPTISSFGTAPGTLTGVRLLCSNTNFTNNAITNAQEYRWLTTGGVLVNGATSATVTSTTSPTVSATSDGTIAVQAYSTSCQNGSNSVPYTIVYGTPNIPTTTLNGNSFSGSASICRNTSQLLAGSDSRATSIVWSVLSGSNVNLFTQSGFSATINPQTAGFVSIRASATNCFGSNNATMNFTVNSCGGFRIASNPATTTLTLIKNDDDDEVDDSTPDKVSLFNSKAVEVRTAEVKEMMKKKQLKDGNKIEFDVSELPRGEYYLHTFTPNHPDKDKKVEKIKVILQ